MKKVFVYMLTLVLSLSVVLAGCSGNEEAGGSGEGGGNQKVEVTAPGTFPIVKEKVTLDVMVAGVPNVEDYATNEFTKWLEEKTNVHVEFSVVPNDSAQDKLNLVLASGEYPDVIWGFGVSPAQQQIYGAQGVFLSLNDLIDKYGVETKRMFKEVPAVKEVITTPDGNIYGLPEVNVCFHCMHQQKMWINQDWLDKLGLEMPTTTEEFYQVLKAFKEKDPNGNGIADEIPLAGATPSPGSTTNVAGFLMDAFIYNNPFNKNYALYLNNGKVDAAFNKPQWREGLKYLRKLYAEGLLYPQTFTQDGNQLKMLGENPDAVILGAAPALYPGSITQTYGESGRFLLYKAVPPLKGPDGNRVTPYNPYGINTGEFIITKDAENPEVAMRWADAFYNEEITLRSILGEKDRDWKYVEGSGEKGINGQPAKWKRIAAFGQMQNSHWSQTGLTYRSNELRLSETADNGQDYNLEVILYEETKNKYEPYIVDQDKIVPPLFFTGEESSELADLTKTINDFVTEMIARFVTGDADLETGWDSYIETLNQMNLKRYLEIYQNAYDRKYSK